MADHTNDDLELADTDPAGDASDDALPAPAAPAPADASAAQPAPPPLVGYGMEWVLRLIASLSKMQAAVAIFAILAGGALAAFGLHLYAQANWVPPECVDPECVCPESEQPNGLLCGFVEDAEGSGSVPFEALMACEDRAFRVLQELRLTSLKCGLVPPPLNLSGGMSLPPEWDVPAESPP